MTKLLRSFLDGPVLPLDILRLVFEEAVRSGRHKAIKYTLISKLVRKWVEMVLYEDVRLYSEKSLRRFLWTLEASRKPKNFFVMHVKSLAITNDVHDLERTARILASCRGVENLTIWSIPSHNPSDLQLLNPRFQYYPAPPQYVDVGSQKVTQLRTHLDTPIDRLRPKRLAVFLDKLLCNTRPPYSQNLGREAAAAYPFSGFPFASFSNLTHLSIINRWTEWSAWSWAQDFSPLPDTSVSERSYLLRLLPGLTHLSLEIQVSNRSATMKFTSLPLPSPYLTYQADCKLTHCVGNTLAEILTGPELGSQLRVLLCIFSFDDLPHLTARKIRDQATTRILSLTPTPRSGSTSELQQPQSHPSRDPISDPGLGGWEQTRLLTSPSSPSLSSDSTPLRLDDPRLVFAHDRDPFKDREAGSHKVLKMWQLAEEMVRRQKQERDRGTLYDPVVLRI